MAKPTLVVQLDICRAHRHFPINALLQD